MLGELEKVDLRQVWKHEALDFTKWLAKQQNLDLLCKEIGGIELTVTQTEASVGSFAVDILAEDTTSGEKVIIENQLAVTNHDHLGKIITYASGLDARIVIWVFKEIREEHRNAVDWLNDITGENVNFFAIQMELWKIGDSPPAPKFNVICSPNTWANAVRNSANTHSETGLFQLDFWSGLAEFLKDNNSTLRIRKARAGHWYDISIGKSYAYISLIVSVKDDFIRCDFNIRNNKVLYNDLYEKKEEIESKLGFEMEWQELPHKNSSKVTIQKNFEDIKDESIRPQAYNWFQEVGERVANVFAQYL
jgi:hypothetical protein